MTPAGGARCGARGQEVRRLGSRAALGIMSAGTMTGVRGARWNWGRCCGLNPQIRRRRHEAWPGAASLGCVSPLDRSRSGTPKGERAPLSARRTRWCGG